MFCDPNPNNIFVHDEINCKEDKYLVSAQNTIFEEEIQKKTIFKYLKGHLRFCDFETVRYAPLNQDIKSLNHYICLFQHSLLDELLHLYKKMEKVAENKDKHYYHIHHRIVYKTKEGFMYDKNAICYDKSFTFITKYNVSGCIEQKRLDINDIVFKKIKNIQYHDEA